MSALRNLRSADFKQVPQEKPTRAAMREAAVELAARLDPARTPSTEDLETSAQILLDQLGLHDGYLGYAMVAVSNAFWRRPFESVPFGRRLLLLPHCMSDGSVCVAVPDAADFHCANCGACDIGSIKTEAENLGYEVVTAEGTTSVVLKILQGDADAVLGVACLDSLERSHTRVVELGVPHFAVPLLHDGCVNTTAEVDELLAALRSASQEAVRGPRTYLPLLRETVGMFDARSLAQLLPPDVGCHLSGGSTTDPATATEAIALDWFRSRGKRLRPFLTASAYAVGLYGNDVLAPDADPSAFIPEAVRRISMAIEALHKASLIHDDIEDNDEYRYGRKTIHSQYGIAPAINIGDYLVGLGYRLIAEETGTLGAQCVSDILRRLSAAHIDLCRGQGAELLRKEKRNMPLRPIDALQIYALKTAPALEVALYAGLRAADIHVDDTLLRQFCVYLGEGYQVLNDLDDWRPDGANRITAGSDAISDRPTLLYAFALEAAGDRVPSMLLKPCNTKVDNDAEVERLRNVYEELGAFDQAQRLVDRLRERAERLTADFQTQPLRELMAFLVGLILPGRSVT